MISSLYILPRNPWPVKTLPSFRDPAACIDAVVHRHWREPGGRGI